jgi:hypothetical protein
MVNMPRPIIVFVLPGTTAILKLYDTEAAARKNNPGAEIVWVNSVSGVRHRKHSRWYASTHSGGYAAERRAKGVRHPGRG